MDDATAQSRMKCAALADYLDRLLVMRQLWLTANAAPGVLFVLSEGVLLLAENL